MKNILLREFKIKAMDEVKHSLSENYIAKIGKFLSITPGGS